MISSSATAARVVGQLRGIATETKQTFVTEKEVGGEGGSAANVKSKINLLRPDDIWQPSSERRAAIATH